MNKPIIAAAVAMSASIGGATAQATEKPNFVLFISDDCTHSDLGCYGSVDSKTPNIDNFARESMRFTQGFEAAPMSSPTRHNLYSGLWPVKSGAYPNHTFANEGTLSVVHHLNALGYKVALMGKSHVSPKSVFPFDVYVPLTKDNDLPEAEIDKFIAECKASDTPFCLFVATNQPHTPWTKGDASQFDADALTLPPMYVDIPETRELFTHYLAEVNHMDQEFGRVLGMLDTHQVADDSVVVFLSEQGNSLPFAKWTCYDAGVHSAYIVRWPGVVEPGSESDAIVEYVDIVPTFVDIAGGKPLAPLDGESIQDLLRGKKKTHKKYTYSLQTTRGITRGSDRYGIRAIYDGRYRYIVNLTPEEKFENTETNSALFALWKEEAKSDAHAKAMVTKYQYRPARELYDVSVDPYCMNNLAEDKAYANTINKLDKELKKWMEECGDQGAQTELDALDHRNFPNEKKREAAYKALRD